MHWLSSVRNKILLSAPALIFYSVFYVFSLGFAFVYSFTNFSGLGKAKFIGFSNYLNLFHDDLFFISLKNTFIILIISFVFLLPLAFIWAYVLDTGFRGHSVIKAMTFTPYVIAPIVVGTIWWFILDPEIGLIRALLNAIGHPEWNQAWIGGNVLTPYSISIVYIWQTMCFHATIMLAGLKSISQDIYEASDVDGASRMQKIFLITLPLMKETFIMNVALLVTGALKIFELVQQLTDGGPNHFSETLVTYMYFTVFKTYKYGYGMALAIFILLLSAIFSIAYIKNSRKKLN